MLYDICKFIHIAGVVLLVGNVSVTAVWKVFADRTGDARVVAFAQRLVTLTDWSFTVAGIVLIIAGGYGALAATRIGPFETGWLIWGQLLFAVSGVIWLGILVPLQLRQARSARQFAATGKVPAGYRADARRWIVWGVVATVPLIAAIVVMTLKP